LLAEQPNASAACAEVMPVSSRYRRSSADTRRERMLGLGLIVMNTACGLPPWHDNYTIVSIAIAHGKVTDCSRSSLTREDDMTRAAEPAQLMDTLADDASYFRPELFAIYGVDSSGRPYIGWGMQLGETEAVYYEPGAASTWMSTSASQVLRTHQRTGEAHLRWLND
jgi:hypothetical protein